MRLIGFTLIMLLLCSCGGSKSTLGSPSSFTATGDGLNLRSALRVTGETALQMMSLAPSENAFSEIAIQLQDRIRLTLGALDQGLISEFFNVNLWRSMRHSRSNDSIVVSGDAQETFVQYQTLGTEKFLFVRIFREADQIHGVISYDDAFGAPISILIQYSMTCAGSYFWDEVTDVRRNVTVTVHAGQECLGLSRYRSDFIPAVVSEVSRRMPADVSRPLQVRNLEEFYEAF